MRKLNGHWQSDDDGGLPSSPAEALGRWYANKTIWLPYWVYSPSSLSKTALGNCGIGVAFGDYTGLDSQGYPTFSTRKLDIKMGSIYASVAGSELCVLWCGTEMEQAVMGSPLSSVTLTEDGGTWQLRFDSGFMANIFGSGGINAVHSDIANMAVGTMNPINPQYCNITLLTNAPADLGHHYFSF